MIEVEGAVPEGLGNVGYSIFAQYIEGEASGAGHDAGVIADTAAILVAGNVADIMVAVLDAPMRTDCGGPCGGWEAVGGRNVVGDLAAFGPQAGGSRAEQGVAGDPDDGLDEWMPLGRGQCVAGGKDVDGAILLTGPAVVAGKRSVGLDGIVSNDAGGLEQFGLIGLQLDQEMVARVAGNFECFFDSAWHPK